MTNKETDFQVLVEKALSVGGRSHMKPVIEKELLHYDILFALDKEGLLDKLTFQGGTSLRLCYGAQRFSEDLDFAGGYAFSSADFMAMRECLVQYIGGRYGLEVSVKNPKEVAQASDKVLNVDIWQVRVTTSPKRRDLPKQMIKLEVINLPSYTREPKEIQHNYDFLPDSYRDVLIMTESLHELLADKLISLVDCRAYVRYRDIWDINWLTQQGATLDMALVKNKIKDYKISDYLERLDDTLIQLPKWIKGKAFRDQMSRFIPMEVQARTLAKDKFYLFLEQKLSTLLQKVRIALE